MRLTTSHMKTSPLSFPKAASKAGTGAAEIYRNLPRRPQTLVGLQHPRAARPSCTRTPIRATSWSNFSSKPLKTGGPKEKTRTLKPRGPGYEHVTSAVYRERPLQALHNQSDEHTHNDQTDRHK